ncbi:hypothetical protein GCM10009037_25570 [Halarchaeum grantii]|uniref:Fido domain-containing protein n=1 Tax=Halarchaeum grantii TaxID=1193105 RepID=A0A830F5C4_9EURY|nr:hypothetical protein [Halarchaeum grantii]GGL40713.1 hypothetical protein GCM10009037_25570 [Halarchaeum grantii]
MGFADPASQPRITDLSGIDPIDFKIQNTQFLKSDAEYEQTGAEQFDVLRHRIWVTRNGDIQRVLDEFPRDAPLYEQCAGWIHAIAGKHFFPDANHRTALVLLRELLRQNNLTPGQWPASISRETVLHSHQVRRQLPPVRLDTLYRHDRLFLVWLLYFKIVLQNAAR